MHFDRDGSRGRSAQVSKPFKYHDPNCDPNTEFDPNPDYPNFSRCKPFKYTYEKEIVMYAYFKKLDYFSTECIYR